MNEIVYAIALVSIGSVVFFLGLKGVIWWARQKSKRY